MLLINRLTYADYAVIPAVGENTYVSVHDRCRQEDAKNPLKSR